MFNFFFYVFDEETATTVPVQVHEQDMSPEELEFFDGNIRKVWHSQEEEWYISVVDVCEVLTDTTDAVVYWRKLKQRLKAEGNETVTNCNGLKKMKLLAADGKMRLTDCATPEGILRIVQAYKQHKGLHKENLRDNMTNIELTLNQLAEVSTTALSKAKNPKTFFSKSADCS